MIVQYEYIRGGEEAALGSLYSLAENGATQILCRVRRSLDNVLFIHHDTVMSELCFCDEYVQDLEYREIDALMRLCGYRVLTLDRLLDEYSASTPLILHFRGVRPDAGVVSRVVHDPRFSFATDSGEQLRVIAEAYPQSKTIGFACHLPVAQQMAQDGAFAVCLYGRGIEGFLQWDVSSIRERCPLWYELPRMPEDGLVPTERVADAMGISQIILPQKYLQ